MAFKKLNRKNIYVRLLKYTKSKKPKLAAYLNCYRNLQTEQKAIKEAVKEYFKNIFFIFKLLAPLQLLSLG